MPQDKHLYELALVSANRAKSKIGQEIAAQIIAEDTERALSFHQQRLDLQHDVMLRMQQKRWNN